jgi:O-antigen ligase
MLAGLRLLEHKIKRLDFALLSLSLGAISIPWPIKFNSISIIILCLTAAYFWRRLASAIRNKIDLTLVVLFALYFILHVAAVFYSSNFQEGIKALEKKIPFLLVPFCVYGLLKEKANREVILKYFLTSVLVAILVCFLISVYNNIAENIEYGLSILRVNTWLFTYKLLSMNINLHPAYMSCFAALGVVFILKRILIRDKFVLNFDCLALAYLLIFITLLASRNVMITCYAIVLVSFLYAVWKFRKPSILIFFILLLVTLVIIVRMNDVIFDRLEDTIDLNGKISNWGNLSLRLQEWEASFELIREHPWFGISPADVTSELVRIYNEKGWTLLAEEAFNSHNQYIHTLLSLGLVGLSIFLVILFVSIKKAILNRDFVYFCFLILFSVFSITESTLEVQKGIVFFAFFNSLLYCSSHKKTLQLVDESNQTEA